MINWDYLLLGFAVSWFVYALITRLDRIAEAIEGLAIAPPEEPKP